MEACDVFEWVNQITWKKRRLMKCDTTGLILMLICMQNANPAPLVHWPILHHLVIIMI